MEEGPCFQALCPFLSLCRGLRHIFKLEGLPRSSEAKTKSAFLARLDLWVSVLRAGAWQGQRNAAAGRCLSSPERTAREHR